MSFLKNPIEYASHFFDAGSGGDPIEELCTLATNIQADLDTKLLREIHYDIVDIFVGKNKNFKPNSMLYHTLRHTMMVALAFMRLLHGLHCEGKSISEINIMRGMLCAYFHDLGMLVKTDDSTNNAFLYIPIHEQRSSIFLNEYINEKKLPTELLEDIDVIIAYTRLQYDPADLRNHSAHAHLLGQALGAADLLAQMGDRYYLESLFLLFEEMRRGKINIHANVLELLQGTDAFFQHVVKVRMTNSYGDVLGAMQTHFRKARGIDKDLYMDSLEKNLGYLKKILDECADIDSIAARLLRKIPLLEPENPVRQRILGSLPVSNISNNS